MLTAASLDSVRAPFASAAEGHHGAQLALDNALSPYYSGQFGWSITHAGNIAAIFGMLNFVSRPLGGVLTDVLGKYYGMRGRLWALFGTLAIGGMAVAVLGTQKNNSSTTIAMMVIAGWFLEVSQSCPGGGMLCRCLCCTRPERALCPPAAASMCVAQLVACASAP